MPGTVRRYFLPSAMKTFISALMEPRRAVSLMGSTIPLVPRMEIPPIIPKRELKVRTAIFSPSGT